MTILRPRGRTAPPVDAEDDEEEEVDPRIAERRDKVIRGRRSKLRRRLASIGLVFVVIIGAVALTRGPLLDVDRVNVSGADRTGADAVIVASGIERGEPMTDLDLGGAASAVGALAWVLDVEVDRSWFGTVEIVVEERRAAAAIQLADGSWYLMGEEGRLLEELGEPDLELLRLIGVPEAAGGVGDDVADAADHLAVVAAMPDQVAERVLTVANVNDELQLWIDPTGIVRLGSATRLEEKFTAIVALLAQVDDRCLAVIDVRVPARPTLTRDPECANPQPDPPPLTVESTEGGGVGGGAVEGDAVAHGTVDTETTP